MERSGKDRRTISTREEREARKSGGEEGRRGGVTRFFRGSWTYGSHQGCPPSSHGLSCYYNDFASACPHLFASEHSGELDKRGGTRRQDERGSMEGAGAGAGR
eukprot:762913-Hanusia_phi.AAC.4